MSEVDRQIFQDVFGDIELQLKSLVQCHPLVVSLAAGSEILSDKPDAPCTTSLEFGGNYGRRPAASCCSKNHR